MTVGSLNNKFIKSVRMFSIVLTQQGHRCITVLKCTEKLQKEKKKIFKKKYTENVKEVFFIF